MSKMNWRLRFCQIGFLSNFKWLENPLNLFKIKNPFGFLQTNPLEDAWMVGLFYFFEKGVFWYTLIHTHYQIVCIHTHVQIFNNFAPSQKNVPKQHAGYLPHSRCTCSHLSLSTSRPSPNRQCPP